MTNTTTKETPEWIPQYAWAVEVLDSRDYTIDEVLGEEWASSVELPKKVVLDIVPIFNQGHIGMCTIAGSSQAYFETYAQALSPTPYNQPYDPKKAWEEAKKKGADDVKGWGYQSALQHLVDTKRTGNYVAIRFPGNKSEQAIQNIKTAIASGRAVIAGSSHTDWGYVVSTGRYREQAGFSGHIYAYTAYDDVIVFDNGDVGGLWSPNNWGGIGGFWISYKEFLSSRSYTNYTWLLTSEHQKFVEAKQRRKNSYLQKAFEAKIWNEERTADTANAREICIMLNRALGLPEDYQFFRKHFALLCEDKILRGKMKLWNEERPYTLASDEEVAMMFTRAVTRNAGLNVLILTREQVAEVCGRDFL